MSPVTQDKIMHIVSKDKNDVNMDAHFEINWLKFYKNSTHYNTSSQNDFIYIRMKTLSQRAPQFYNNVVFNLGFSQIISSKFF